LVRSVYRHALPRVLDIYDPHPETLQVQGVKMMPSEISDPSENVGNVVLDLGIARNITNE